MRAALVVVAVSLALAVRLDPAAPMAVTSKHGSCVLAVTSDGATLVTVNPDSNSITLVDADSRAVLAELPVGTDPRSVAIAPSNAVAYVANQASDTISVVDLDARVVTGTVPVGNRPVGVAVSPDGRWLVVAELGEDRVRYVDTAGLTTASLVPVPDRPYGLAFAPDGRLLVTHLLSGQVTVLSRTPPSIYMPVTLKAAPPATASGDSASAGGVTIADVQPPGAQAVVVDTWPQVAPAPAVLVNAAGSRAYLPQTMANGQGLNTRFDTSVFPKVSVLNLQTGNHQTSEHISLPEKDQPVGLPWDVALARDDAELWVVNAASNDVSVLDISQPSVAKRVAHVPVGDNPRGIVLSPDGGTAYVNNTLAGTVSIVDAHTYTVSEVITVTNIPPPPALLHGKRLYHSSARSDLARARWISCNTCHIEGEHDGRTWLLQYLGDVPTGATPIITRNTTSLLGMIETYPLRWSAEWDESADSEFSVRFEQYGSGLVHDGEMNPTLGLPNQGRSYDLDCLASFVDSLTVPGCRDSLTESERRGKAVFESSATECLTCHPPPLYTDLLVHDVGTADASGEWFGPLIDTPSLRFLYDSAPYLHDGSATTLRGVLTTANHDDRHGVTSDLSDQEITDLVSFLLALPYCD